MNRKFKRTALILNRIFFYIAILFLISVSCFHSKYHIDAFSRGVK